MTNEEAERSNRKVALGYLVVGLAIAYWVWPDGITDLPLAQITLGGFLRFFASAAIALVAAAIAIALCL